MSIKTCLVATVVWTLLMVAVCGLSLWYVANQPGSPRDLEARVSLLGGGLGTVTAIGYGVIWLPHAYVVGRERRRKQRRSSRS